MLRLTIGRFRPGQIVMTRGVSEIIAEADQVKALQRHLDCDWGNLRDNDKAENDLSLEKGLRLLSAYHDRNGVKFWIITEADRSATTLLLPEEY